MRTTSFFQNTNALFLAPHTDDVELGCGATLARCVEECDNVHVAVFSTATQSLPSGSAPDRLKAEFLDAMKVYDIDSSHLHIFDYEVRKLNYSRQDVLEDLVRLKKQTNPDVVFTTSGADVHQDHQVVHQEAVRAFKNVSLLGYELPWNHLEFSSGVYVAVQDSHMEKKLAALQAYKSQTEKNRSYFDPEFTRGLARVRGLQQGGHYAEAFEAITIKI